jgi:hypothetical protein
MTSKQPRITGSNAPRADYSPTILIAILATAFLLRLVVSVQSGIQIDESRTLFAIDTVAHRGVPLFRSDVLYLVGTPIGYLFAPFAWMFDDGAFLHAVRFGNVLLSTAAVWLIWRIAQDITGSLVVALVVSVLAAFDPSSLLWGTLAGPYAATVVISLLLVHFTNQAVTIRDERRLRRLDFQNPIVGIVLCLLVGSFTYYSIWLFVPGIVIVSLLRWGKAALGSRHPMRIGLEISIVFPIVVWWLGSWIGPGSGSDFNPGPPSFNQIWNNLDRLRDFGFNFNLWTSLYYGSRSSHFVPVLIAVASGMISGWLLLRSRLRPGATPDGPEPDRRHLSLALLLCSYWLPILIVADGSLSPLLLPVVPVGYAILLVALWLLVPEWSVAISRQRIRIAGPVIAAILILLPVFVTVLQGARWQLDYQVSDPDYFAATAYAATIKQSGQAVITPFTTAAYMELDAADQNDIVLLAGIEGSSRVGSETRKSDSGVIVDYWSGRPAITTKAVLCGFLLNTTPLPIILIDSRRLDADWGFKGDVATAIRGGTTVLTSGKNGLEIRQPIPVDQWTPEAKTACGYQEGTAT